MKAGVSGTSAAACRGRARRLILRGARSPDTCVGKKNSNDNAMAIGPI
jgi:hypothetical protein